MSALIFSKWNGQVHTSIDHVEKPSFEPKLGDELKRIPLHPEDAERSINTLIILHQGHHFRACLQVAA